MFILDTGAGEVAISNDLEKELIHKNQILKSDYLASGLYKTADGSIILCRRVKIKNISVCGYVIKNVVASIGVGEVPLLLGQTFLSKFSKWSIDNSNKTLQLETPW